MPAADLALLLAWLAVLGGGLGFCVIARGAGLATTYVRDLLHVGASLWIFGWPWWRAPLVPIAVPVAAFAGLAALPSLADRVRPLARFRDAVSDGDERFAGLVLYGASFAALTAAGLLDRPFPAAAALLALAWGDGLGGLVGRRFGRARFQVPFGKPKSVEGALTVALLSGVAIAAAAWWFHQPIAAVHVVAAALVAAAVEAVSPRASDNVLLPSAVFLYLRLFA